MTDKIDTSKIDDPHLWRFWSDKANDLAKQNRALSTQLTEARAQVAAAYEAAAVICDNAAGHALVEAQEAQDRADLRECVLLEDRSAILSAIAASIRAETEGE